MLKSAEDSRNEVLDEYQTFKRSRDTEFQSLHDQLEQICREKYF